MNNSEIRVSINEGQTFLGIELGSTRIKAVLITEDGSVVAAGGHSWENSLSEGIWSYPLEEVISGIQLCYADLKNDIKDKYGLTLKTMRAMGISAMMHGYLAFDKENSLLVPFRTWRNNITEQASKELTELFQYPIPQRWSIAHLYQAILNNEEHVSRINSINTLSGWVHEQLTNKKVLGVGDASGMFPINTDICDFNSEMLTTFDSEISSRGFDWKLSELLPEVLPAGVPAGKLSAEGAATLDPDGDLQAGILFCPPEGDAGTGMVATNSVKARTGNVSAGTSVFAMIVLENQLSKLHHQLDLITTPSGELVAMAHSNNCSTEYSAWIDFIGEAATMLGAEFSSEKLYNTMMNLALSGDRDCGGLLAYGYHSGEHVTGFSEGRPLFTRMPNSKFTVANFIRAQLFTSLCALRTGLNILFKEENVTLSEIKGHGGFFKTEGVGERIMAAACGTPVSVMKTAGEGGAWGIALLSAFMKRNDTNQNLSDFLDIIFKDNETKAVFPDPEDEKGFQEFFERYTTGLVIEQAAVDNLKP